MAKHHYNPNFILRRFADHQSTLWILDKESGRVWPKKGGRLDRYDAFAENGYNTVKYASGAKDDSVEDYYTEVEARAAPVIDTVIRSADAGLLPAIGQLHKDYLVRFLWAQWARSPFQRLATLQAGTADRAMEQAIHKASQTFGFAPSMIRALLAKNFEQTMQNAIVMAPTNPDQPDGAVVQMRRMVLDLLKIPPGVDAHFITSDSSCLVKPVSQPGGSVLMPIAKRVSIQLSRPENSSGELTNVGAHTVGSINQSILDAALRYVAGPCREYLCNLYTAISADIDAIHEEEV